MGFPTLGIDAYQLTTLAAHADGGRLAQRVSMSFFFRKMPRARGFVVFCGLRAILAHAMQMRLGASELAALRAHPLIGPALASRPELGRAFEALSGFEGDIDAAPEGTLVFAGPGVRTDGSALVVGGAPLVLYTPLIQVRTDMLRAKLIETPWLGYVNYLSMVATKAARVITAARGKPVLEFGARRTHPAAAVDAAYAAYIAGCASTSNMAAYATHGIPSTGTMDHFAVQASEREGVPRHETEREFFKAFAHAFPANSTLLVDTYDTEAGIRAAVEATEGKLTGVRLDSNVNRESVLRARRLLDDLGATKAKIFVSDALDERRVQELADVADGFGVGENITCSPDAATGIGAVAKLVVTGYGQLTMKLCRGSAKATLPGELQAYRFADHDLVALATEPPPSSGRPLLAPAWRGGAPARELPSLDETRFYVKEQLAALPAEARAFDDVRYARKLVASDGLVALIERLTREAGI
jgi:nicotinate phosphoribosyltransferase